LLIQNQDAFAADVAVLDSGLVRVVASKGAGQLPGELLTWDVNPILGTVNGIPGAKVNLQHAPDTFVMPSFTKTDQRIAIGLVGEDMVDPLSPQIIAPGFDSKNVVGVGCTLSKDPADYVRKSWDLALQHHVFWYPYWDGSGYDLTRIPAYTDKTVTAPQAQCYLRVGESLADSVARWTADIEHLTAAYSTVAVMAQGYRGQRGDGSFAFTEQELADGWAALWPLCLRFNVATIMVFEYDRADGLKACPNLQRTLAVWRQSSPNWQAFPTVKPVKRMPMIVFENPAVFTPAPKPFTDRFVVKVDGGLFLTMNDSGDVVTPTATGSAHNSFIRTPGKAKLDMGGKYSLVYDVTE